MNRDIWFYLNIVVVLICVFVFAIVSGFAIAPFQDKSGSVIYFEGNKIIGVEDNTLLQSRYPTTKEIQLNKYLQPLSKCLADKDVILFYLASCPHCKTQLKMFGDNARFLTVAECSSGNCPVESFPTWQINNKEYIGTRSLNELAQLSGCLESNY